MSNKIEALEKVQSITWKLKRAFEINAKDADSEEIRTITASAAEQMDKVEQLAEKYAEAENQQDACLSAPCRHCQSLARDAHGHLRSIANIVGEIATELTKYDDTDWYIGLNIGMGDLIMALDELSDDMFDHARDEVVNEEIVEV